MGRVRKTKVAERVSEALTGWEMDSAFSLECSDDGREVKVACVPAGRALGLGSRFEGGMVIVKVEATSVAVAATRSSKAFRDSFIKRIVAECTERDRRKSQGDGKRDGAGGEQMERPEGGTPGGRD